MEEFDVLGLGSLAIDDILYVPSYPKPDTKMRVSKRDQRFGGLAGTALATASTLGAKCAYAGRLGIDTASQAIRKALEQHAIQTRYASVSTENAVGSSTIIVTPDSRTILSSVLGKTGADDFSPPEEVIRSAKVLLLDHHGIGGGIRAANIARKHGIPVVADFERFDSLALFDLISLVDHLIISESFARQLCSTETVSDAVLTLRFGYNRTIVITSGSAGAWYSLPTDSSIKFSPSHSVNACDTVGCGDVFHGAFAAGIAFGFSIEKCIRYAGIASALKAEREGGWNCLPRHCEVSAVLSEGVVNPQG